VRDGKEEDGGGEMRRKKKEKKRGYLSSSHSRLGRSKRGYKKRKRE
jgi:hypothetical protein